MTFLSQRVKAFFYPDVWNMIFVFSVMVLNTAVKLHPSLSLKGWYKKLTSKI
jgi:hypothetical protein